MKLTLSFKGGPGSGHHGHSGRPGKVGGSLPGSGGGGSSTPRNEMEEDMHNYLTQVVEVIHKGRHKGIKSFDELVLEHGEFFDPPDTNELPSWCERGQMKACYYNSTMALPQSPDDIYYTEGYAFSGGIAGFPFQHGWLTTADGRVIDPTWRDGTVYFGIRMNTEFVLDTVMETSMAGIMVNDWENDNEIGIHGFPEGALK